MEVAFCRRQHEGQGGGADGARCVNHAAYGQQDHLEFSVTSNGDKRMTKHTVTGKIWMEKFPCFDLGRLC